MMKKLLLFFCILSISFNASAQIGLPRLSPIQKIEQEVGLTKIEVEGSRPSMKGRVIFGDLVPYGTLWRTGANRSTKITFNEKVSIGNQLVDAGTYSLLTLPAKDTWEIYLYTDLDIWEAPKIIDTSKVAAKVNVVPINLNRTLQSLTITFDDLTLSTVNLGIAWENTYVALPIQVRTNEVMTQRVEKSRDKNSLDFHLAGFYYLRENIHLEEAKNLMETAILLSSTPDYRNHLQLSLILEKLKDMKGAIQEGKKSLELARVEGSKYGVKENKKNLKKWGVEADY